VCHVNLFLQHWGSATPIGQTLRCSLELLQLETGLDRCPLLTPFDILGPLCTKSWLRCFWECIWYYGVQLHLDYTP
jgi:hypothetical protein